MPSVFFHFRPPFQQAMKNSGPARKKLEGPSNDVISIEDSSAVSNASRKTAIAAREHWSCFVSRPLCCIRLLLYRPFPRQ
mmetsp:Transcript_4007/g.7030  ORF Transcript_4007/g.7030 Transcript_4007/m.7030 type:complete len:80 (-) Transcript_4007:642-881(-)